MKSMFPNQSVSVKALSLVAFFLVGPLTLTADDTTWHSPAVTAAKTYLQSLVTLSTSSKAYSHSDSSEELPHHLIPQPVTGDSANAPCECEDVSKTKTEIKSIKCTRIFDQEGTVEYKVKTKSCDDGGDVSISEVRISESPDDTSFDGTDVLEIVGIGIPNTPFTIISLLEIDYRAEDIELDRGSTSRGCTGTCERQFVKSKFRIYQTARWVTIFGFPLFEETTVFESDEITHFGPCCEKR